MSNEIVTASSVISFVERLEDDSATFYEGLSAKFDEPKFAAFAKECAKVKVSVVRTYRETITDALEACFSFEGLKLADHAVDTELTEGVEFSDALGQAVGLEQKAVAFYLDAAERSQALLGTIPRAFTRAAKKRSKRLEELESMLG